MGTDTIARTTHSGLVPALFERNGPLSAELTLEPAKFGLGLMPTQLQPEWVATSVCGFCSTGCNLNIHLRSDTAIGLTPAKALATFHVCTSPFRSPAIRVPVALE